MPTINQLCKKGSRTISKTKSKSPYLMKSPQKKGIVVKIRIVKPKKPNSAQRKTAKVFLTSTKKNVLAGIPGFGYSIQKFSVVLIRGGRLPDVPGIHYKMIRGKYDFTGLENVVRGKRRSKYGLKKLRG